MKHTPGKWWFARHDEFGRYDIGSGDVVMFRSISRADSGPGEAGISEYRDEHQAANARLIAAAPEMYDSLDAIGGQAYDAGAYGEEELRYRMNEILRLARAATAKADGK